MRLASPRLSALAAGRRPEPASAPVEEILGPLRSAAEGAEQGPRCELCAAPLSERHRHLVDVEDRGLRCVCRACSVLFDRREAGGEHYRLVPERVRLLEGFSVPDGLWSAFDVPVDVAFFFEDSRADRPVAFYPGPMGATESQLGLERWPELLALHPALHDLEPDVEAVLVNRRRDDEVWLVPVDVCYALVGVFRESWKGLAGGPEVWRRVDEFYEQLSGGANHVRADARATGRKT